MVKILVAPGKSWENFRNTRKKMEACQCIAQTDAHAHTFGKNVGSNWRSRSCNTVPRAVGLEVGSGLVMV